MFCGLFVYLFIVILFLDLEFIPSCLNCISSLTRDELKNIARVELEIKLSSMIRFHLVLYCLKLCIGV